MQHTNAPRVTPYVNRTMELARLDDWWGKPGARCGGKTLLLQRIAEGRARTVYHTFGRRAASDELAVLAQSWRPEAGAGSEDWGLPTDSWENPLGALARE